uniref:Endonuclease/exonuclease/phosphatase domain-containing protein n=1 Tax=Sinocyclocheilus grahami TaxID=75366 RepID=A0A672R400_SINGR
QWCIKDRIENIKQVYRDQVGRIFVIEFKYILIILNSTPLYRRLIVGRCIIVGDFNIKCSRLDVRKGGSIRWEKSRVMLMEVIRDKGLLDVWRYENREKRVHKEEKMMMKEEEAEKKN